MASVCFFIKKYFNYVYMSVFVGGYVLGVVSAGSKDCRRGCQMPQSKHLTWVLGIELQFSGIAVCDFKPWTPSLALVS